MFVRLRYWILAFGLVNAALYSALLPLWEGFDEAFHYGYVETLWQTRRLPVLGRTMVPNDVADSFRLAPVSHIVRRSIVEAATFEEWFALPRTEQERRRHQLDLLRPEPGSSSRPEYEAHQPPLAYLLLAALDWPMANAAITARVLVLRVLGAAMSVVLLFFGALALCRTLDLPERFADAALFTILCSEMLYATIAHVANDWLAVGVGAMFLAALAQFFKKPDRPSAWRAAVWLAAGLLTKAYFLVFVVLAIAAAAMALRRRRTQVKAILGGTALVLALAGPWYARNLVLYGNLSGTHEAFHGIGIRQALAAAPRMDWPATIGYLGRGSLWTGNNSFTSFSRSTLDLMLALLAVAVAGWAFHRRSIQPAERIMFTAAVLFSAAIGYASCASFIERNGAVAGASPWYAQVLLAPVMALAYLGMSRWPRFGRPLAALTTAIWTWVLAVTWTVKLFPLYSGRDGAPMRLPAVWDWYAHAAAEHARDLSLTALAPAPWLYAGMALAVALAFGLATAIIRGAISPGSARAVNR